MKNIHLLPTTPNDETAKGIWIKETRDWCNIYITADEEIKPNKYCLINGVLCKTELLDSRIVSRQLTGGATMDICKSEYSEIILTTDPELITDGVQAIPDDFLEWFVKNPSCEFVEVKANFNHPRGVFGYQTIIPKEEQKQNLIDMMQDDEKLGLYDESLEEAKDTAWNIYEHVEGHLYSTSFKNGFEAGAKWQAERMYSEEDMIESFNAGGKHIYECEANRKDEKCCCRNDNDCNHRHYISAKEWLKNYH